MSGYFHMSGKKIFGNDFSSSEMLLLNQQPARNSLKGNIHFKSGFLFTLCSKLAWRMSNRAEMPFYFKPSSNVIPINEGGVKIETFATILIFIFTLLQWGQFADII